MGKDKSYIQCTTPSLKELNIRTPVNTKVSVVLDGFSTGQVDLLYVDDPNFSEFQQPTITVKGDKRILEIKVSCSSAQFSHSHCQYTHLTLFSD